MTSAPQPRRSRRGRRRALGLIYTLRTQLTRQFITRNRRMAFVLSVLTIAIAVASVHVSAWWFSPGVMILPILAGGLLLWPRALRIFFGFAAAAVIYDVAEGKAGAGIVATIVLTAAFATAVHLSLDLATGEYIVSSAGHPPAVHYDGAAGRWRLTRARGIVLGVVPDLHAAAAESERGVLQRGDALMLYTDGLVEAPGRDIDVGTDRLLGEAERMLASGFRTGAPALVAAMQREIGGSDDCALVLLWRT